MARTRNELIALIEEQISRRVLGDITTSGKLDAMVAALAERRENPYAVAKKLLAAYLR
jgi:hypothetical protein